MVIEKGGRVWRDAAIGDHAKTNIGLVKDLITETQTKPLKLPRVNEYLLTQLPGGALGCDLLIQHEVCPSSSLPCIAIQLICAVHLIV